MPSRWIRLLLVAALFCATDAPLALVQGYAWATMAWRASQRVPVAAALSRTFDGRHPCPVCLAVRDAARGPSLRAAAPVKLDVVHQPALVPRAADQAAELPRAAPPLYAGRASPPPVPPPDRLS